MALPEETARGRSPSCATSICASPPVPRSPSSDQPGAASPRWLPPSGGQKQRTALARAVIRNPRILILDDSLSSVDTQTEEHILGRLRDIMRDRTTLLISHRCSTVRDADQIVVLRNGRIVERGTHDELLVRGGYYADLYQKQLLEDELERE